MTFKTLSLSTAIAALLSLCFLSSPAKADGDHELGLLVGPTHYIGDLEESRFNTDELNFGGGLFYRYYFNPSLNFRGGANFGTISADDEHNSEGFQARGLNFESTILEGHAGLEWNILPFVPGSDNFRFAPYVFGGVGIVNYDPEMEIDGEMVPYHPDEEGDVLAAGEDFANTSLSIPMGVGIKYNISSKWNLGAEIGARKAFSDHLDGVSEEVIMFEGERTERGNPDSEDWYGFSGITLSYTFRSYECAGDWD